MEKVKIIKKENFSKRINATIYYKKYTKAKEIKTMQK